MKLIKIGLISIFSLTIVFHTLVLLGVIDFNLVWGGRIKSTNDMLKFESISLLLNVFFLLVILVKTQVLRINLSAKLLNVIIWLMIALFAFNTLGNLMSINFYEKLIFTPLTLLIVVMLLNLVLKKR